PPTLQPMVTELSCDTLAASRSKARDYHGNSHVRGVILAPRCYFAAKNAIDIRSSRSKRVILLHSLKSCATLPEGCYALKPQCHVLISHGNVSDELLTTCEYQAPGGLALK